MDRFDFTGKKIIVTGASSGVGRETAILLSGTGAKVILIARREEELKKTLSMMEGTGHTYKVLDMSKFDEVVAAIQEIVEQDGAKIDCVAHCAGIAIPRPLRIMTEEAIDETMKTNFYSFAAILKCAAMKKLFNNGGAIVGVSSTAVYGENPANGIYAASKGAIDSLMKTAAKQLRSRGIRVNTIRPCDIKTEMLTNLVFKTKYEGDTVDTLPDNLMLPEGVASVILALLSDSMRYVSGVALVVDEARRKDYQYEPSRV